MRKRTVLILAALLVLVGITVVVWEVNDWPPPRLILKYGFPPTGDGATGESFVDASGIEFVRVAAGATWCPTFEESLGLSTFDNWKLRLGLPVAYDFDVKGTKGTAWIESARDYWVSRRPVPLAVKRAIAAERDDVWLSGLTELGFSVQSLKGEPLLAGSFNGFLAALSARQGGRYHLPSRDELIYAWACGALSVQDTGMETVRSGLEPEKVWFEDGAVVTGRPDMRWYRDPWPFEFRLVWIPPEDE